MNGTLVALGALMDEWLALALMVAPVMISAIHIMNYSQRKYPRLVVRRVD